MKIKVLVLVFALVVCGLFNVPVLAAQELHYANQSIKIHVPDKYCLLSGNHLAGNTGLDFIKTFFVRLKMILLKPYVDCANHPMLNKIEDTTKVHWLIFATGTQPPKEVLPLKIARNLFVSGMYRAVPSHMKRYEKSNYADLMKSEVIISGITGQEILYKNDNAIYFYNYQSQILADKQFKVAMVYCVTFIKGIPIMVYAWRPYTGSDSYKAIFADLYEVVEKSIEKNQKGG
jgi:hypothetical protein